MTPTRMRVLATGLQGFLGSGFAERYGARYDLVGFDHKTGDEILDYDRLLRECRGCDQVLHLAGIPAPDTRFTLTEYLEQNVTGTANVARACCEVGVRRLVFASSMAVYGLEDGVPYPTPIRERNPPISYFAGADALNCPDVKLSYHVSKVMAEQIIAWYGLTRRIQTVALRFGPIGHTFRGTRVSMENATQAIRLALESRRELWYEAFTISDRLPHVDLTKAMTLLGFQPISRPA